jgi:chromosome segregation ATPase
MNNLGLIISGTEPKKAAEKILQTNDKDMKKMRSNIKSFSKDYSWEKIIGPIEDFCRKPSKDHLKKKIMFESLINDRRDLTIQLRKEVDEKEGHIRKFEASLRNKEDALVSAEMRLSAAHGRINELGAHCDMLEKRSNELEKEIDALNIKLGKFQGSIVYPYYRFTSSIGKSGLGKLLQRLLK